MVQRLFFLILGIAVAYVPFFLIGLAIGHWMDLPMKESSLVVGSVGVFLVGVAGCVFRGLFLSRFLAR
ncbi:hypothetical protein ACV2VM_26690 (plasmid) [Escherichia coli]